MHEIHIEVNRKEMEYSLETRRKIPVNRLGSGSHLHASFGSSYLRHLSLDKIQRDKNHLVEGSGSMLENNWKALLGSRNRPYLWICDP